MWNLTESELLLTIAELSVAFAGFASIAGIFGKRFTKNYSRVDAGRLMNMLSASLGVMLVAILPLLPMLLEWSQRLTWGSSGAAALLAMLLVAPSMLRRATQMRQFAGYDQAASVASHILAALAFIGFLCSMLGFPIANPFVAYFASIVALLAFSAILFFRVIASMLHETVADAE